MVRLCAEEARNGLLAAVEHHMDILVARGPHIGEELSALLLGKRTQSIAQLVEGPAQRCAPLLVEAGLAAIATAVGAPALDTVNTAPRGIIDDFALVFRGKLRKEAGVVGEFYCLICFKQAECVGQGHFAVPVMVAIGLAVSGNVNQLGRGTLFEAGFEARCEVLTRVEQAFKRDGSRGGAVVKEDCNRGTGGAKTEDGAC